MPIQAAKKAASPIPNCGSAVASESGRMVKPPIDAPTNMMAPPIRQTMSPLRVLETGRCASSARSLLVMDLDTKVATYVTPEIWRLG